MSTDERITRPRLERTRPMRTWSDALATPRTDGEGTVNDAVTRAVDLGYRVVDDYIRLGQRAAQRLSTRSFGPEAAAGDLQEMVTRMAQYTSDFLGVWSQFVEVALGSGVLGTVRPSSDGSATARPHAAAAAARRDGPPRPATEHTRVNVEVQSTLPTEVSFDLDPAAAGRPLVVQALRSVDPEKPRITDVRLEAGVDGGAARLALRVPGDQPPGVYSSVIVDGETSRLLGTLHVRIRES